VDSKQGSLSVPRCQTGGLASSQVSNRGPCQFPGVKQGFLPVPRCQGDAETLARPTRCCSPSKIYKSAGWFLNASLKQVLAYTSDEASAMMLLHREKARKKIMDHAASILQHFWLVHKKAHISARRQQRLKESKRSFVDLLQTVRV
jgi:hypothetical protein